MCVFTFRWEEEATSDTLSERFSVIVALPPPENKTCSVPYIYKSVEVLSSFVQYIQRRLSDEGTAFVLCPFICSGMLSAACAEHNLQMEDNPIRVFIYFYVSN